MKGSDVLLLAHPGPQPVSTGTVNLWHRTPGWVVAWDDDARSPRHTGYRFAAAIISHALWLYFRFPLGLRMVEELLAARGIILSPKTVRPWAGKFGRQFANQIRRRLPRAGDKWHLDEVVLEIAGVKHWLWRAVDQTGIVLDVLVQRRRDTPAAQRMLPRDAAPAAEEADATATRHDH